MRKIGMANLDGKTRDERETFFPMARLEEEKKGAGSR